jgi:hypothetical protein
MTEILTKVCSRCKKEKVVGEFYKDSRSKRRGGDGFVCQCKDCLNEIKYIKHPEIKRRIKYNPKPGYKVCTKCKIEKPIDEFHNDKRRKDGKYTWCKECNNKLSIEWLIKNPNHAREYYVEHRDALVEYSKKYREENKELVAISKRNYAIANWKNIQKYMRVYRKENEEKIKEQRHQYNLQHREENKIRMRNYYRTPNGNAAISRTWHKRRSNSKFLDNTLNARQWEKILERQNCACDDCNREFNEKLKPTKDHAIPLHFKWFGLTYGNTRALCRSCNSKKYNHTYFMKWAYELSPEALNGITTNSTSTNS